jgi:hypothetical protein
LWDIPGFGYPGADAVRFYLPTVFFVDLTDKDEIIEVAFTPSEKHEDENLFEPLFCGNESFITDAFVRPYLRAAF